MNLITVKIVCYSGHGLNNKPFNNLTIFDHWNTRLVCYSDTHWVWDGKVTFWIQSLCLSMGDYKQRSKKDWSLVSYVQLFNRLKIGVHMKRRKNAIVVIVEISQMAVTTTKFRFFYFKKVEVQNLENFEKRLILFLNIFNVSLKVFYIF